MKITKCISVTVAGIIVGAIIHDAMAVNIDLPIITIDDNCAKLGLKLGASCTCNQYNNVACTTACMSGGNCVLQSGANGACVCDAALTLNCTPEMASQPCSDGGFGATNTSTGVQTGHTQNRNPVTCECENTSATVYRCGGGWYDVSSSTASTSVPTCKKCPTVGNNAVAGQSNAGAKLITSCYAPANTNITDNTGTYHFTSTCKYSN